MRDMIKKLLEDNGYRTVVVGSGVELIAILTANLSDINAVVLDMSMAGTRTMPILRRMSANLPVLAMITPGGSAPQKSPAHGGGACGGEFSHRYRGSS